jgi:enoyl-CoA hydratase
MPGWGLTVLLPRAVGLTRARQMSFTGNYVDAATALTWGLVNEVVAHDELLARAEQLARDIATTPRANIEELRSIYNEVTGTIGAASWDTESRRSRAWMRERFDAGRLAVERENIVQRGRSQL